MARIPNDEIERLKKEIDLKTLVESYGVKLEARGKDFFGLCPLHIDKNPSLVVTPEKNLWNCLGACRQGGSVIDWVMKMEKVSFREAVELLRSKSVGGAAKRAKAREPLPSISGLNLSAGAEDQEMLNQVIGYYHETLKESPDALAYLERRKLIHPELIDHFKLGYANRTLCYRLPQGEGRAAMELRGRLQRVGIMRESGHEHFNGSLVIPVFDGQGNVTEVYGRKIAPGNKLKKGIPFHLYLPGPHKGVFNVSALAASKEIILCEALIDALTFWCFGFRNVTASYGVNGFTAEHLAAFKAEKIERIYIAYDSDEAGDAAAAKLAEKLTAEGIECRRIKYPVGKDANGFAQHAQDVGKNFGQLIAAAAAAAALPSLPHALPAAPVPAVPVAAAAGVSHTGRGTFPLPVEIKKDEILIALGDRKWRVRGFSKNLSYEQMKVNILVSVDARFFVDTIDLYSARLRSAFIKQAADELEIAEEIVKNDLGKVFLKLEELQDDQIKKTLEPKREAVVLSESEKTEALAFLQDPKLLDRILADFEKCGVVGEQTNKLTGYLAAVSRKLENPLAVIIQSSSAAGKTWLMENILSFVPEEERVKYSAMTGQSLFYLGETDLKHKILAIVEEEGAERAVYALKLLQSEGELSIASTGKDPATGKLVTHEYRVEGPVMIFVTTTSIDIDEEMQNRCLVLTVNESREQTKAIHRLQRERRTLSGLQSKLERTAVLKLHRNAQRLLRPLKVVNPYAPRLTFLDDRTRTRRDHDKYLNLIEAIALLHQYQRPARKMSGQEIEYIEVQLADIETANRLASEVLGRSLDELPPQTRQLLHIVEGFVDRQCQGKKIERSDFRFSRRQVREYCNWGNTRLAKHLERLEEMEYLILHRGGRGQSFVYELLYGGDGKNGSPFLMGLLDVDRLKRQCSTHYPDGTVRLDPPKSEDSRDCDGNLTPLNDNLTPSKHPQNTPFTPRYHPQGVSSKANADESFKTLTAENPEKTHIRAPHENPPSYRTPVFSSLLEFQCFYKILAAKAKEFEESGGKRGAAAPASPKGAAVTSPHSRSISRTVAPVRGS